VAGNLTVMTIHDEHPEPTGVDTIDIGPTGPTYSERMKAFPDVNEELKKYSIEQNQEAMQKYVARFYAMMKALNMGRTHHVRVNSWGRPEPHRADGSPMTKPSRASRAAKSRGRSKTTKHAKSLQRVKARAMSR